MKKLLEGLKVINGLAPAADRYNTNPATDVVSMSEYQKVVFLLAQVTAGTNTGTATITVQACDDFTPSNTTAIGFKYYANESFGTSDDFGAAVEVSASGFTTTANKTAVYAIEVDARDLPDGKPNVRLVLTEVVNDPVTGVVLVLAGEGPCSNPDTLPTAIA